MLAKTAVSVAQRNAKWFKRTGVARPIVSVVPFSDEFKQYVEQDLGIPIVDWSGSNRVLEELEDLTGCDLFLDEVGTYFDSRTFKDLPVSTRLWLAQASKLGVDIYGGAQDFAQVDISFRRLTSQLFYITKIAGSRRPHPTKPPVRWIWGLCAMRELDPVAYDEESKKFAPDGIPRLFWISRMYCEIFDTNKRVPRSRPVPYKHIERTCQDPNCKFEMYVTRDGHRHKISHV